MAARCLLLLAAAIALGWARPAAADDLDQCGDTDHPQDAIPACSRLIASPSATGKYLGALHGLRATAYFNAGDYANAIADFTAAIPAMSPKERVIVLRLRAMAYYKIGEYDKAIVDYTAGLRPPDAVVFNNRGMSYLKTKRYPAAIADYDAALKIRPRIATALYGRGIAELAMGDKARGERDEADARAIESDIAELFAGDGVQ